MTREELIEHLNKNVLPCLAIIHYTYPNGINQEAYHSWVDFVIATVKDPAKVATMTDAKIELRLFCYLAGWKEGRDSCMMDHER